MDEFIPKKEEEKFTAGDIIKTGKSNVPELEFKATMIRILPGLKKSQGDTKEFLRDKRPKLPM